MRGGSERQEQGKGGKMSAAQAAGMACGEMKGVAGRVCAGEERR